MLFLVALVTCLELLPRASAALVAVAAPLRADPAPPADAADDLPEVHNTGALARDDVLEIPLDTEFDQLISGLVRS